MVNLPLSFGLDLYRVEKTSSSPKPDRPFRLRLILLVTSQNAAEKVERKPKARSTIAMTKALRTAELFSLEVVESRVY